MADADGGKSYDVAQRSCMPRVCREPYASKLLHAGKHAKPDRRVAGTRQLVRGVMSASVAADPAQM
jgi:hypothetical protein